MLNIQSHDNSKKPLDEDVTPEDLSQNSLPPSNQDPDVSSEEPVSSYVEDTRRYLKSRTQSQGILHLDQATAFTALSTGESCVAFCSDTARVVLEQGSTPQSSMTIRIVSPWDTDQQGDPVSFGTLQLDSTYAELLQVQLLSNGSLLVVEGEAVQAGVKMPPYAKYSTRVRLFESDAQNNYVEMQTFDSKTYGAEVLVSGDNRSVYLKGKRLAQMWQGWRGYDGSFVIEERYFHMPSYKGTTLKNDSYKLSVDDPSYHTALCESPDRSYLLSGGPGTIELISRSSRNVAMKLDTSSLTGILPKDARINTMSLSRSGDSMALAFSSKGDANGEVQILTVGLDQSADILTLINPQLIEKINHTPDYLGFTSGGALLLSTEGTTEVRSGSSYQHLLGSIQATTQGIDAQGKLVCLKDDILIGYELSV